VIGLFEALSRPLLRHLDAEDAHGLAILGLRFAPIFPRARDDASLAVRAFGLNFPNPVGMAAGFRRPAAARLRLRRGRHRDAAAAARQSAAAAVPPAG
jgi:dihydroorotate dehydrogenase